MVASSRWNCFLAASVIGLAVGPLAIAMQQGTRSITLPAIEAVRSKQLCEFTFRTKQTLHTHTVAQLHLMMQRKSCR
jgi:hypothetical protein